MVFDDSFEHEVWHDGDSPRLVLIADIWHPELSSHAQRWPFMNAIERKRYDKIVAEDCPIFENTDKRGH